MRRTLRGAASSLVGAMALSVVGILALPGVANATPVCVDVPVQNLDGYPIATVCVDPDAGSAHVYAFLGDSGPWVDVNVDHQGRVGDWVNVCYRQQSHISDIPNEICILP